MIQYTDRAWLSRARVAGSLVRGSGWVLRAWLSDGTDNWDTSIIWRNERSFVFLSGATGRFLPTSLYEYWRHMPPYVVLFFYLYLRAAVLMVLWYLRALAPFGALGRSVCIFFFDLC